MTQACDTRFARPSRFSASAAVAAAATTLLAALAGAWRRHRNRKAVTRLLELDEHMLADLGVTRGDVAASLHGSDYMDPSLQLARLRNERRSSELGTRRLRRR